MSNLLQRIIAGLVFIAAVVGAAWSGPLLLGLLFLFFAAVGLYELYEMERKEKTIAPRWLGGMSTGIFIYLLLFLSANESIKPEWMWALTLPIAVMFCIELFRTGEPKNLSSLALTTFGWIYVIAPLAMINFLGKVNGEYESEIIIGYFLVLWSNDTGAYGAGRLFGRTKLFERVSPNKTWEGLIGGVLFSVLIAWIISRYFESLELRDWIAISTIVGIFGNLGDLFESHVKRIFKVKDSGNIIPGHGGVLDRFDGLLLSLPVVIAYFKIIETL